MNRSDYLETKAGQLSRLRSRRMKTRFFSIDQEPKSKNGQSKEEKKAFRASIKKQLVDFRRRPHRGDIVLEIDFVASQRNAPALQTLVKNYLDLLHKPMPGIDNLQSILFHDDSQIKFLFASFDLDNESTSPCVRIRSTSLALFLDDLVLADRIVEDRFSDASGPLYSSHSQTDANRFDQALAALEDFKEYRETYVENMGRESYESLKRMNMWQIQEAYLQNNSIDEKKLLIFLEKMLTDRQALKVVDEEFQIKIANTWKEIRNRLLFSTSFLKFGSVPTKKGESAAFKESLKLKLKEFRDRHPVLFPLIAPISITIIFIPPTNNVGDLDNLARRIVPFVNEIFDPPATLELRPAKVGNAGGESIAERIERRPRDSISNYQILTLQRRDEDPEAGAVLFLISDAFWNHRNIWERVDAITDALTG